MSLHEPAPPVQTGDADKASWLLSELDAASQAELTQRWPHLKRAGRGAHNRIAADAEEQLARARRPRLTPEQAAQAELVELVEATVRRILVEELPVLVRYLIGREAGHAA